MSSIPKIVSFMVGVGFAILIYGYDGSVRVPVVIAWIPSVFGWGVFSVVCGVFGAIPGYLLGDWIKSKLSGEEAQEAQETLGPNAELPSKIAKYDEKGYAKCPGCNFGFYVNDPNFWDGTRHKRCGQAIEFET